MGLGDGYGGADIHFLVEENGPVINEDSGEAETLRRATLRRANKFGGSQNLDLATFSLSRASKNPIQAYMRVFGPPS